MSRKDEGELMQWQRSPDIERGILCGADQGQEWLLPWWWAHYSKHNTFPVTFCDFGMSPEMRRWCLGRGEVIDIEWDPLWVASFEGEEWNEGRCHWFKKPLACLHSPYKVGLWLDIDCEIRGSLFPLFTEFVESVDVALTYCGATLMRLVQNSGGTGYNGGVILFRHGCSLIQEWAKSGIKANRLFLGDDHLLSYLIYLHTVPVQEWPHLYNWVDVDLAPADAVIVHWIRHQKNALRPLCEEMYAQALM